MARTTTVKNLIIKQSVVTQSQTLTDSDAGRTFFLNAAGGFTVTLPKPRAGVGFEFIVKTAPTTLSYTIATNGASAVIVGGVTSSDINKGDADFASTAVASAVFMVNRAQIADSLKLISDGTYWYASGFTGIVDAIQLT